MFQICYEYTAYKFQSVPKNADKTGEQWLNQEKLSTILNTKFPRHIFFETLENLTRTLEKEEALISAVQLATRNNHF